MHITANSVLHLVFILFFVTLPLYPVKYMYIVRWIPIALLINWFIFEGCPLTIMDKNLNDEGFIEVLVKPFVKLSRKRIEILTYIFLFVVFLLCNRKYYKYIFKKK
jgi:hypothetical protein